MWLPEIYNRVEGTQLAVCQTASFKFPPKNETTVLTGQHDTILNKNETFFSLLINSSTTTTGGSCQKEAFADRAVYLKTFLIAVSNIPGALTSIFCIDKIGRRNLLGKKIDDLILN